MSHGRALVEVPVRYLMTQKAQRALMTQYVATICALVLVRTAMYGLFNADLNFWPRGKRHFNLKKAKEAIIGF